MEPFEISVSSTALTFSLTILLAMMGSPTLPVHLNDRNFSWPLANNWIKRKQKTKTDRCIKQYSLILKKSEQCSDLLSQVFSIYNKIKEAMVQDKFTALKSGWQILLNCFFDHPWSRKSNK